MSEGEEVDSGALIIDAGEEEKVVAANYVPLHMISDAKNVYERLKDLEAQARRQERRVEILQHEFDATPVDQNRRIGRHVDAAKGRLHLINVSLEEAEEKLIEVSLPWALVLMRELEDQIGRLDIELNMWADKFNKTTNAKFKLRRDETQDRIDKLKAEVIVSRMLQSVTAEEYEEYWEERVAWLLESKLKAVLLDRFGEPHAMSLQRSFDEVERMEKHLHADKQQGVSRTNSLFDISIFKL
eukprot:g8858.t1